MYYTNLPNERQLYPMQIHPYKNWFHCYLCFYYHKIARTKMRYLQMMIPLDFDWYCWLPQIVTVTNRYIPALEEILLRNEYNQTVS